MTDAGVSIREAVFAHTQAHILEKKGQKSAHFGSNLGGTSIFSHAHGKNSNFKKFSETKFLVIF